VEVSVVGIPDDLLGHRPVAVGVATTEGLDQAEILSYCAGKLAKFKCPSEIRLVRTLPKSPSGKVNRAKCLELLK
jgi:acyl-CoA synthetase (AMP-forming)/AMP-acid ligase II